MAIKIVTCDECNQRVSKRSTVFVAGRRICKDHLNDRAKAFIGRKHHQLERPNPKNKLNHEFYIVYNCRVMRQIGDDKFNELKARYAKEMQLMICNECPFTCNGKGLRMEAIKPEVDYSKTLQTLMMLGRMITGK